MGKKSTTLVSIIALILGSMGAGIGSFAFLTAVNITQPEQTGVSNTWYKESNTVNLTNPTTTAIPIANLLIEFEVQRNESVYFSYQGNIKFEADSGECYVNINFYIDGVVLSNPQVTVQDNTTGNTWDVHHSVSLQHYTSTLDAGTHNATIQIYGNNIDTWVRAHTLFIQTYHG